MDTNSSPPEPDSQPDDQVDSLVEEYFNRRQVEEGLTAESFVAEHPEQAEKLRSIMEGLALLSEIGVDRVEHGGGSETSESDLPMIEGYELIEELGRGGMGVVYKATQLSTKRVVALKVMLAGPFASSSARRRFEREIELAARLQHSNIVRVLEGGRVKHQQYYSMDYVDGISLDLYMSTVQPDVQTVLRIFRGVCDAVEYAHEQGVIHRDLKPTNILINDEGEPHILDFGLAKAVEQTDVEDSLVTRLSSPGQVLGTLPYLSPEQAAGEISEIDTRTDIYALGVMLYEALTGSLPYDTKGRLSEIIQRITELPPQRPSSQTDRVDSELETVILKALEKEKPRRYQSVRELREDLRRYLESEPILARPPSSLYVLRKRIRKHPTVAIISLVLVVILTLISITLWSQHRTAQRRLTYARENAVFLLWGIESHNNETGWDYSNAQSLHKQFPSLPETQLVYAQGLYHGKEPSQAILHLGRFLEDPRGLIWPNRLLLSEIYHATGDTNRADELRQLAQRDAPDTADAWFLRSMATLDLQYALECVNEAVRHDPQHALALRRMAYLYQLTDDLDASMDAVNQCLALRNSDAFLLRFKTGIHVAQKQYDQAIELCSMNIRDGIDIPYQYLTRGHIYRHLGEYERAMEDYDRYQEAGRDRTTDPWNMYHRHTPLWILGRVEEAMDECLVLRQLIGEPSYADARHFLMLRQHGRMQGAQEVLAVAIQDNTDLWLDRILRCLAGEIESEQLLAEAQSSSNPERLCEALYYAGEVCLLSNRRTQAHRFFVECVATGVEYDPDVFPPLPMNEYELAKWRLETLFADSSTP